jgi:hypothetical protein
MRLGARCGCADGAAVYLVAVQEQDAHVGLTRGRDDDELRNLTGPHFEHRSAI